MTVELDPPRPGADGKLRERKTRLVREAAQSGVQEPRKKRAAGAKTPARDAEGVFLCAPENIRKLRDALSYVPADTLDMRLKIGGALNSLGQEWGRIARKLWDEWSQTAPGSFDAKDQDVTWKGFDPQRRHFSLIFFEAKKRGWKSAGAEQWTELGNAHRLVRCHGEDIRYVHPLNVWFIWDGVFWRRDDSGDILRRAEATIEALFDEAKEITDEEIRTAFRKFALKSQSRAQLSNMTQLAQHNLRVVLSPDVLDADPMLLGVLNGTIDLNTVTFREGRREDYITKQCAVAFDPAAQCPNWIEFQKKIAGGNADLVAYKRRVFGLLLTGEMVEILFILHGDGSNGKTTELETIQGVLGDYAHAANASVLLSPKERGGGATPEIVVIKGKRAVFINETDDSDHLNESRVKYLCGNDTMSGRDLFESVINFRPTHKSLLRTNHKPKIRGTDLGIWRRIHYWPYLVTIGDDEKIIKFRETKLDPERPGILNWMLAGLKDYLAGGLKPPPVVCQATKKYQREMNTVGQWIEAMCERSTIDAKLRLKTLHDSYARWALDEIGWAASKQKLAEALREHGFESILTQGVTVFRNIRLNDEEAAPY